MKWNVLFISMNLLSLAVCAQMQTHVPVRFQSSATNLFVTPEEALVVTTRAGEVALADSAGGYWRNSPPETGDKFLSGVTIDQGNFFNRDTGFLSGFINNGGKYNIVYHTTNSGKSWQKVDFGLDGWVDAVSSLDNGEAWMSVSGKGIAYTKDFGKTWQSFSFADAKQRFAAVFFNEKREGITGSLWNMIAYTNDNCQHWKIIPTPLDQLKYNKTDKQRRPEINTVAIYKDYLMVSQEGMVFYSKRDSINWVQLPDYLTFYTDARNTALFFYNKDGKIVKADEHLMPVFTYEGTFGYFTGFCRNGDLFLMSGGAINRLTSDNKIRRSSMLTDQIGTLEPEYFAYNEDDAWGVTGSMIYKKGSDNSEWKYLLTLPITVENQYKLSLLPPNTIVYNKSADSIYYFDIESKTGSFNSVDNMLKNFAKNNITEVAFSTGSQGCFHSFSDEIVYILKRDDYVLKDKKERGSKHETTLKATVKKIDGETVNKFVDQVCYQYTKKAVINDLGFSEEDYEQCRKDIVAFQSNTKEYYDPFDKKSFYFHRNNIDHQKLLATVDSVKNMDVVTLSEALLNLSGFSSTTTDWVKVTLIALDGSRLEIVNAGSDHNAMYFPWSININGASVVSLSPDITGFIRTQCPSMMVENDKVPILHSLVKKLYK